MVIVSPAGSFNTQLLVPV